MSRLNKVMLLLFVAFSMNSYAQKFGHINTTELLAAMPERATIEQEIRNTASQYETQLAAMQKELESKLQDFQANEATMSEAIRETRYQELTDLDTRMKEFNQKANEELAAKERELSEPLIQKAKDAIAEVAKENGFTYIFDNSAGFIVYEDGGEDVLVLVKKKLGLE